MSAIQAVLTIVGALVVLASVAGGLWAVFRQSAQDATIKRVREERDDYLQRLNYIEPRHRAVEQQNEVLLALHNPTDTLQELGEEHDEILRLLNAQKVLIEQIDARIYMPRGNVDDNRS